MVMRVRPTSLPMPLPETSERRMPFTLDHLAIVAVLQVLEQVLVARAGDRSAPARRLRSAACLRRQSSSWPPPPSAIRAEAALDEHGVPFFGGFVLALFRRRRHAQRQRDHAHRKPHEERIAGDTQPGHAIGTVVLSVPTPGGGPGRWRTPSHPEQAPLAVVADWMTPRSAKGRPASPTMSQTVRETRASRSPALAAMAAASSSGKPDGDVASMSALAGVQADADANVEARRRVRQRRRAADRARRAVERRDET